jgi:RNA polymerase sigma-70 factor (ECF subfamily)
MSQTEVTDKNQLVSLLQAKNRQAFSILYDNYSAALLGIICRMIPNKNIAEELLQDVFVKVWKNVDTYETGKGTLFTWMLNIARNTCIDHLRSKQHKQYMKTSSNGPEHQEIISKMSLVSHSAENRELRSLTKKLDVKYSEIIDKVYFLGYSQEEVSEMLNIPLGTVKTRSRTGLQQLRKLYKL